MAEQVAVVLAGGGARGAYEAGALSVLLPELERRGQRPTIVIGTSVGALNGAFLAATAHLPAHEAAARAYAIWSEIEYDQVLAPLVSADALGRLAAYLGAVTGVPRARLWSVLDPSPLRTTLPELVDFDALERNVAGGAMATAAVVATSARTGRSVVFHRGGRDVPPDDRRGIDYVGGALGAEHVLASAALPALFPAVQVEGRWYSDGGTRLNTPIKPALEFGAERVVVVALSSTAPAAFGDQRPDALVAAGSVLQTLFADQLLQDLRSLEQVNELVAFGAGEDLGSRRRIPYALVAPERPDTIGALARDVFAEHYSGLLNSLRHRDLAALGRSVGGGIDAAHGELLSFLFFAPEFTRALANLGRRDAGRRVSTGLWRE